MPKSGLSCNWCGYVNLPATEPNDKPVETAAARERSASMASIAKPDSPAVEFGDDDETTSNPYKLTPEEAKMRPCPECGQRIDITSQVCHHCGFDARSKQKIERSYEPIDRHWESGWPLSRRLTLLLAIQVMNVATIVFGMIVGGGTFVGSLTATLFYIFLQAFLIGTYDSVRIRRNEKGRADIIITWRVGFIPQKPKKINWREHEGVGVGLYNESSVMDWFIVFMLLPYLIIPAILWWYYVIHTDRFYAALCRDRGYPETYLYRGMNEKQAKEIAQVATDVTGLPLTTPL